MKKLLCLFSAALVVITGCKVDDPGSQLSGNVYNTYQPTGKNTYWTYSKTSAGVAAVQTETRTLTGDKQLFNKRVFYTLDTKLGTEDSDPSYYYHDNGDYIMRIDYQASGFTAEYLYLKDDYPLTKTWTAAVTDDGLINGVPAQIVGAIVAKGITRIVSGKTFTNVMHTRVNFQYDTGTGFATTEVIDYYVAKGIGIIETDYSDGTTIKSTVLLADYDIK